MSGSILDVVKHTDRAVDVFITGHTHQAYNALIDGRIVTEAYAQGNILTDIDLVISSETHAVIEKRARNIIVSRDVPKDSGVVELVNEYKCLVAPTADKVIGNITGNITVEPNNSGESALCDLIADAQLYNTSKPSYGGAVVAFTNPEGIRSRLNLSGSKLPCNVTYGEAFSVQPFGNNLVTMTLSGTQIDALLEQQFDNTSFGNKGVLLQVSKGSGYTWNKSAPIGKKVSISSIKTNGTSIDPSSLYRVTVDSFMADGGNNLSVLKAGVNRTIGSLDDINVTANYLTDSSPVAPGHRDRITVVK
jgi:5'-nucleotidase